MNSRRDYYWQSLTAGAPVVAAEASVRALPGIGLCKKNGEVQDR